MGPRKKLIVVAGPTASGKTAVAIALAQHFSTHVVSADARQIFRELAIGTAKPTPDELNAVPHHFINTHSIHEVYNAAAYGRDALACIRSLFAEHDKVILCGGSGLYIRAVCEGFDEIPDVDPSVRQMLREEYSKTGLPGLRELMETLDPDHYQDIDRQNPQRLMRALEVVIGTGESIAGFRQGKRLDHDFTVEKIGLELPRAELYQRIDARMDRMIAAGLFEEASALYPHRHRHALQTVGYQEIFGYIEGKYDRDEAIRLLKQNSRRYAKRQLTWFRRDPGMTWLHPANINDIIDVAGR